MKLIPINIDNKPDVEFIEKIYIESFPPNERRAVSALHDLIVNEKDFVVLLILNTDKERVGFITYWLFDGYIFAEHFAISSEFRNGGYGAKAMEAFFKYISEPIIIEVETPNNDNIAKRRIEFYKRLNFKLWDNIEYEQPPYLKDSEPIPMKIMSFRDIDLDTGFEKIKSDIYKKVYQID